MAIRDDLRVQTTRARDLNRTQKIHGMNVKSAVAVRDVQQTLSNVQEVLCEELQALQGAPSQRAKDDCVRRIKQSAIVMKQALELQKSNIAKIRGAGRSAYVKRTLEARRQRQQRDENGGKRLSAYEEVISWGKRRQSELDQAEAITPCRKQPAKDAPAKESVPKRSHAQSDEHYIQTLMDLDPAVQRTAEECVLMLAQVPNGKKHCVALSWSEREVIPFKWRGMIRRLEHLENGDEKKAFKSWGHGAGNDRIIPIDDYTKWVLLT